ncbi:MAG: WYL domain-containing protein [Methylococcales bacterium]|nr:WYL domain-containing protein [Methylococcales bacterium]
MAKTTAPSTHEKVSVRLAEILIKLNRGEKLDPNQLAEEFGVHLRTIQRDLLERFAYLPLKKDQHYFVLDPYYLGKLTTTDIERFAGLSGIKALFPALNDSFLRELFDTRVSQAYLVKGHHYEDLSNKSSEFKQLEQAIVQHLLIHFIYKGKTYTSIAPYKLVNHKGIWYLAAKDEHQIKTFCFSRIKAIQVTDRVFIPETEINRLIEQEDSIWFGENKREVVLKVDHSVAVYFKRRNLLPNQQIDKELEDGSLIVSSRIAHDDQILPLIKYWIPHITVIAPIELRITLLEMLHDYLHGDEAKH